MKTIHDYLPKKDVDTTFVQGRVPTVIVEEVRKIMEQKNLSWPDILTACLQHLVEERKRIEK